MIKSIDCFRDENGIALPVSYLSNDNTMSGVKSTLMTVQRPWPMSLAEEPSSHTSSSTIR